MPLSAASPFVVVNLSPDGIGATMLQQGVLKTASKGVERAALQCEMVHKMLQGPGKVCKHEFFRGETV